jgi:acyl-CoA thioesterase FadM
MSRVKIKFPDEKPLFTATIPVRIGDINYGAHLGHDAVLSIVHEARMQMLRAWGWDELKAGGVALIMADVMIAYKGEAFYGDVLNVNIYADEIMPKSFDLLYEVSLEATAKAVAHAKTGMACYDYSNRKIAILTHELKKRLEGMDN